MFFAAAGANSFAQSRSGSGIGTGDTAGKAHAIIKSKPEPKWFGKPETSAKLSVVLHAVFRANGKVTDIKLFEIKPENPVGLTSTELEKFIKLAVDAAEKIKFIPARKDGRPVSWRMQLEYVFDPGKIESAR
jgi:hypothetical protein